MKIRTATINDLRIIQELNHELCIKENKEFDSTIDPEYPFSKKGEQYFKFRLESNDSCALIVEDNDQAVGYLVGGLIEPMDYRTITHLAEVENMFIKDSMRSKGIGGDLVSMFEAWCKEKNVQRIRYVASAQNARAISFYKKQGCKETELVLEKELT
ncbi:MAG: GNAT family N-acetyltransferase [Patescibacteria group bacterium]|nr:GNAT family N-acetyltransferase [Patescibacteria group bacterium]